MQSTEKSLAETLLQNKLDKLRKEYNKLEKLKEKQEDNGIFDNTLEKEIDDIYKEIESVEEEFNNL